MRAEADKNTHTDRLAIELFQPYKGLQTPRLKSVVKLIKSSGKKWRLWMSRALAWKHINKERGSQHKIQ